MKSDFARFASDAGHAPPLALTERILGEVKRDLAPSLLSVLSRLSLLHAVSGALTLSICPQFGFRLFGEGIGLMALFMGLGGAFCVAACGFFFLSASLLISAIFLRPAEIALLRRHRWLGLGYLLAISLGFFLMVDASIVLGFVGFWIFGSLLGGLLALELGWLTKTKARGV